MFGYIRARRDTMSEEAWQTYEAVYCQLCRTMGRRRGQVSRCFLNYDFAFLAMVTAPAEALPTQTCRRCFAHPLRGKPGCVGDGWLEEVVDKSVILTWWKLRDAVADGGWLQRWTARFLCRLLQRAYRGARTACPNFDAAVSRLLGELSQLEAEGCPSIDRTADCFARLLAAAVPTEADAVQARIMGQILYHIGRWIYLMDAVDDLAEDGAAGRYNPVKARFPAWSGADQAYLRQNLAQSLGLAGAAFQLLPANAWTAVMENILYSGLPGVEELVFSGRWREH